MFANSDKLRDEVKHECELPAQDDIITTFIKSGRFILFRRRFRKYFMMNIHHNRSKIYFKSTFTLNRENLRHLNQYYYTIHPFSDFRTHWAAVMAVVFLMQFMVIPLLVLPFSPMFSVQHYAISINLAHVKRTLDFICFMDIIATFNTGYLNNSTNKVILKKKTIAKKYLTFWFWIDILSNMGSYATNELYYLMILKVLRIVTMFEYVRQLRQAKQQSIFQYKIFKLTTIIGLMFLFSFCLVYTTLNELILDDSTGTMLGGGQKVIHLLLLLGWEMPRHDLPSLFAEMVIILFGFFLKIYILSELLHIVNKFTSGVYQQHQMVGQLEEYMNYKKLPMNIRRRVKMYFEYGARQRYYEEAKVLQTLSPQLKNEIMLHAYLQLLEKVELFSNLPVSIYYSIIYKLKRMVFLPSEVIIACDTYGDSMYFISSGTVAVYTASGKEVCHIADGANFGEKAVMLENVKRIATVVAIECCEIFQLQRNDLLAQLQGKPEVYDGLKMVVSERHNSFKERTALGAEEIGLEELLKHI